LISATMPEDVVIGAVPRARVGALVKGFVKACDPILLPCQ
jgi:hypothetical protein